MAEVLFSAFAESDIEDIFVYYAEFNLDSSRKFIKELMRKFKLLAENPQLERSQSNFILNFRSFSFRNYTIFYFPIENGVEIYRVLHGAGSIEDLFENYFEGLKP